MFSPGDEVYVYFPRYAVGKSQKLTDYNYQVKGGRQRHQTHCHDWGRVKIKLFCPEWTNNCYDIVVQGARSIPESIDNL